MQLPPAPDSVVPVSVPPSSSDSKPEVSLDSPDSSLLLAPPPPSYAEQPSDIIPAYLPSCQVHLLSGASGAGKTAFTFALLKAIQDSSPFLGLSSRPPAFIGYLAADRTWADHRIWLQTVGLTSLPYYSVVDDVTNDGEKLRTRKFGDRFKFFKRCIAGMLVKQGLVSPSTPIDTALDAIPKDSLFIVDPISIFLGGDLLKYDTVYTHMLDLSQFCIRRSCTILGIAHAGKQKNDTAQRYTRPQDRIVGTTAQTGCAGTTMHLAPESETGKPYAIFTMVPHHAKSRDFKLKRSETTGLFQEFTEEVVAAAIQDSKKLKKDNLGDDLLPFLQPGFTYHVNTLFETVSAPPSAGGLGISRATLYRKLETLRMLDLVDKGTAPGTWKRTKGN